MKKLILLLTLTMMFGQTKLETRVYSIPINVNGEFYSTQLLSDLIGSNFNFASIQFMGFEGDIESD